MARSMGGGPIPVHNKIKHQHILIFNLQSLEAITVMLHINKRSILFVNAY